MIRMITLLALSASLVACGDDQDGQADGQANATDTTDTEMPQALAVADATALPECGEANNLQLVYLLAEKQFQTCQDGTWIALDIDSAPMDSKRLHNALMAIKVGDTLETMLPEAKEYILSLGEKDEGTDLKYSYVISNDPKTNGVLDCSKYYNYRVNFSDADDTALGVTDYCD
jgi:hypothetical protein